MPANNVQVRVLSGNRVQLASRNAEKLTPLLERIGSYLVKVSQVAFANQRFDGKQWPARSLPNYAGIVRDLNQGQFNEDRLTKARPALVDTGNLRRSIYYRLISNKTVGVASSAPYAALHQEGGTDVIPISDAAKSNLAQLLSSFPKLRPTLGFLFRRNELTVNVPQRKFLGVPDASRSKIRDLIDKHLKAKRR